MTVCQKAWHIVKHYYIVIVLFNHPPEGALTCGEVLEHRILAEGLVLPGDQNILDTC